MTIARNVDSTFGASLMLTLSIGSNGMPIDMVTDDFFADGDLERIESHRQRIRDDGRHMMDDGVEFEKEAMLAALQDSKDYAEQWWDDVERLDRMWEDQSYTES